MPIVYKTIVLPHLEFCSTILYLANKTDLQKMQKIQNRAMRIIIGVGRYTSINLMLSTLNFVSIEEHIWINSMVFIYKIIKGLQPGYMSDNIIYNKDVHCHNTRGCSDLFIDRRDRVRAQNTIFYRGFRDYNKLPLNIKNAKTVIEMKILLQKFKKN